MVTSPLLSEFLGKAGKRHRTIRDVSNHVVSSHTGVSNRRKSVRNGRDCRAKTRRLLPHKRIQMQGRI